MGLLVLKRHLWRQIPILVPQVTLHSSLSITLPCESEPLCFPGALQVASERLWIYIDIYDY